MANSADPDQLASSEANWSGATLFAKQGISGFSRTRVKLRSRISSSASYTDVIWASARQNQQNCMCSQRTQISRASTQSDQSSLSAWRKLGSLATHLVHSVDSDQMGGCPGWSESLLGTHPFCWFCHALAYMSSLNKTETLTFILLCIYGFQRLPL